MRSIAADLAQCLARNAEAVCRHYLSNGRREGRYWLVGDVANTPGRSLFVRLTGPDHGPGAAGKWSDAATGAHGDLLDLIAANRHCAGLAATLAEARDFLALPPSPISPSAPRLKMSHGSSEAARRLWAISTPIAGTVAEVYLRRRGITDVRYLAALRFHPRCWYRPDRDDPPGTPDAWPALIAAIRDTSQHLTGVHRTWLDPAGTDKAPVATPRRVLGHLLGHGVHFGAPAEIMAAGEGIETMLSLRQALPTLPAIAALSARHLAALVLPPGLRRLYIARDDDAAGRAAVATLFERARDAGIEAVPLDAAHGDLNDDLRHSGREIVRSILLPQLHQQDRARLGSPP